MFKGILNRDIEYYDGIEMVLVPKGSIVLVDTKNGVACHEGSHFELFSFEFSLLN